MRARAAGWVVPAVGIVPAGRPRTVLTERAPGGRFDLVQARFEIGFLPAAIDCLSVVRHGRRVDDAFHCLASTEAGHRLSTREAGGVVRCDLRAALVAGGAPRAAASVAMRLDDGSTGRARLFSSRLGRGFLAVPPPGRGLRRIDVLDRSGRVLRRFRTRVPPAARQCGYDFALSSVASRTTP